MICTFEYNADTGILKIYSREGVLQKVLAEAVVPDLRDAHGIMRAAQWLYDEGRRHGWALAAHAARSALEQQQP